MTKRDNVRDTVLSCGDKNILLELATGSGKTKIAIEFLNKRTQGKILIVVPRLVLINTWKDEFAKWNYENLLERVTFVTYVSFPKMVGKWNAVVFDECHHLSERCRQFVPEVKSDYNLLLSATVGRNLKKEIKSLFPYLRTFMISTRDAIHDNVLPDPKVILIPLTLDNINVNQVIVKNKGKGNKIVIPYSMKWHYRSYKGEVEIHCTQQQYYDDMSSEIMWYKNRINNPIMKRIYLHKCGERLKWLSAQKTELTSRILQALDNERTLTFCSSIVQTKLLGKYCINSKNKKASEYLEQFNSEKINHITACAMIDEGSNLRNCKIFIFSNLNSSDRLIIQRTGRALRHPEPVIIIPYFRYTRDSEIVKKMCENYNQDLITKATNIQELCQSINK